AEAFYASGAVSDAAALARRAYEMSPSAQTANFLRQAEAALADQLKAELVHGGKVPRLKVSTGLVREMPLSAPERYLLSRIDGLRAGEAFAQFPPFHERDPPRCLRGSAERGLTGLRCPRRAGPSRPPPGPAASPPAPATVPGSASGARSRPPRRPPPLER